MSLFPALVGACGADDARAPGFDTQIADVTESIDVIEPEPDVDVVERPDAPDVMDDAVETIDVALDAIEPADADGTDAEAPPRPFRFTHGVPSGVSTSSRFRFEGAIALGPFTSRSSSSPRFHLTP